ncbi:MAG: hypothetical protein QOK37_2851 [Thermoanaerobaculia bacterium]|jgi:hypothetical protein|nr:hypothetical protein [Thermoanaerobaculia bacterium]
MNSDVRMAIGIALIGVGVTAIVICIGVLTSRPLREIIAKMPLAPEQWVTFPSAGTFVLHGEDPGWSLIFLGLRISLQAADGRLVTGFRWTTENRTYGIPLWRCLIPEPGRYYLRIANLPSDRDLSPYGLNFARTLPFRSWGTLSVMIAAALLILAAVIMLAV